MDKINTEEQLKTIANVITSTDYNDKRITTELLPQVFKTSIVSVYDEFKNGLWNKFLVEPINYGKGLRNIVINPVPGKWYSDNPQDRYPQTGLYNREFESIIDNRFQYTHRLDIQREEARIYFKDASNTLAYLNEEIASIAKSFNIFQYEIMNNIFAPNQEHYLTFDNKGTNIKEKKTIADKINLIRSSMVNNITLNADKDNIKNVWEVVIDFINLITKLPTYKFNIGLTAEQSKYGSAAINRPSKENLILLVPINFKRKLNTEVLANIYHKELLDINGIEIITVPYEADYLWLLDKRVLQVSMNLESSSARYIDPTMETEFYTHFWFFIGLVKHGFGTKIKFDKSKGWTTSDILANLKKDEGITEYKKK